MQKVVTVTTWTNNKKFVGELDYYETEWEKVNEYLNNGYKVVSITPVVTGSQASYMYSLTFVLEQAPE